MLRVFTIITFLAAAKLNAQQAIDVIVDKADAKRIEIKLSEHYLRERDSVHFFKVWVDGATTPVMGNVQVKDESRLVFIPIWSFTPGVEYQVTWKERTVGEFSIPLRSGAVPTATIYPSTDTIPENLLKLYLVFSEPMREGKSYDYLHILEGADTLQGVFLELQPELWNNDRTQLTVWLDPGRIKRDLLKNREMGVPIREFSDYTIIVSSKWKSRIGISMSKDIIKHYYTVEADRKIPDHGAWRIIAPQANSKDTLVINFGEPLDYSLASTTLTVSRNGVEINGSSNLTHGESTWKFWPESSWKRGSYSLTAESRLEDLAGNNLVRLFDTNLEESKSSITIKGKNIVVPFKVE